MKTENENVANTVVAEYIGYPIYTRVSSKGNTIYGFITHEGKNRETHHSQADLHKWIEEDLEAAKEQRIDAALGALIEEFGGRETASLLLRKLGQNYGTLNIQYPNGAVYVVSKKETYNAAWQGGTLHLGCPLGGEDFETALDKAIDQFCKSPSKRSKKISAEVSFILDEIQSNWDHSCEQEGEGLGNRRYHWHGNKGAFLENLLKNPCSGLDNIKSEFESEFVTEGEEERQAALVSR